MSGYEVIDAERTATISCPDGGFDVETVDGKVNVRMVDVVAQQVHLSARSYGFTLVEVVLRGARYKADGKIGSRPALVHVWPDSTTEPNAEDADNFVPWFVLPSNLQHAVTSSVGLT